MTLHKF